MAVAMCAAKPLDLASRDSYQGVGCDNIMLGKTDTDDATNSFYGQCEGLTQSLFVYDGDTVAFYCQWKPGPQCDVSSAHNAFTMITNQCGLYGAGSYSDNTESARTYSYGYTNWRENDYCNVPAGTRINN
ncbi:hypothetical protein DOTSEDRAFT_28354 [Dothistroma septosporum NZE10]|uniref:Uncharacterized protein n=1 Tax=Dothistroma septosporum (strain NZE10 / CBS 128990) TaxID=675120 RepID=M2Y1J7_DOTSN|nr:hypothetical protein DOTSEDRAFT_28354 [Dothistroma septosporum NZE10]